MDRRVTSNAGTRGGAIRSSATVTRKREKGLRIDPKIPNRKLPRRLRDGAWLLSSDASILVSTATVAVEPREIQKSAKPGNIKVD